MTKKQCYIPGKKYEWTKEAWETTCAVVGKHKADHCGPFGADSLPLKGESYHRVEGQTYQEDLDIFWEFIGNEEYFNFTVNEEGVEIPEYLIPFYGEKEKKEILSVEDLEVGKEYIVSRRGVNDDWNIIYWARNDEVIFVTDLLYHIYGIIFIENISHFRNIPEKTREEKLSEKYNVSLDTIKRMMEDGLIQEEED